MKSVIFPETNQVCFFNGEAHRVVGTHGQWVKIKNRKGKTKWVDTRIVSFK